MVEMALQKRSHTQLQITKRTQSLTTKINIHDLFNQVYYYVVSHRIPYAN